MPEQEDEPTAEEVTPADIRREERASIPALFIDTWAFLTWAGHLRMVLGESLYGGDHYRGAFVMELEEAERFATRLLAAVRRQKEREAQRTAKARGDE